MRIASVFYEVLIILSLCIVFMYWLLSSNPALYSETLPEFIAAILGVFMGFALSHWSEYWRDLRKAKQVLKSIAAELSYNIEVTQKLAKEVHGGTFVQTPFKLFKVHTWDVFNKDLRIIQNIKLISDLGELYHELSAVNEAMKISPIDNTHMPQTRAGWKRIGKDIQDLLERIENELRIVKKN